MRLLIFTAVIKLFFATTLVAQERLSKIIPTPKDKINLQEPINDNQTGKTATNLISREKPPVDLDAVILSKLPKILIDRRPSSLLRNLGNLEPKKINN